MHPLVNLDVGPPVLYQVLPAVTEILETLTLASSLTCS